MRATEPRKRFTAALGRVGPFGEIGETVGSCVSPGCRGFLVGRGLGAVVGPVVGPRVGLRVGGYVGDRVGFVLGWAEGFFEGA